MDASRHKMLATILAQTVRICIPFFVKHKQEDTLRFFNSVLELASNDVKDKVFYGRTRLLIDLMENIDMPTIHDDVFQLGAHLLREEHEESQVLYRAVNRFVLSHQLRILAECPHVSPGAQIVCELLETTLSLCSDRTC